MKIYTRTGDKGTTSVIGARVSKDDARVEAYGTIDELNSLVGQAAAWLAERGAEGGEELLGQLLEIQQELFDCGSDLSYADPKPEQLKVEAAMTARLEEWIDRLEEGLPPLQRFILPGGSPLAAQLHVCRTVCRRAERRTVTMAASQACPEEVIRYLNRLSDYFFTAARHANSLLGAADVEYIRGANVFARRTRTE
ncbi:cob(I)yrinic acid a,c-diamide adenosyltransferase [Cohnella thailandensis]|uniref:Corrinoid adenosyltransferase n=1 Tax=Cohnella thailandensis TaxID=557557 RepID=A0A841SRZ7_9BACL|nr:cob(I)yrinic acid a,c-diamide adenosyltransferase [Cohnella thailandensis]MBB6633719.1 cob(I)yrinic acid a,c-diamide adenosyltransferase [Cohnella thailandensis]MBP1976507.1 cob(I)alamin adenosyltransferase [Cohnella thailandensis]